MQHGYNWVIKEFSFSFVLATMSFMKWKLCSHSERDYVFPKFLSSKTVANSNDEVSMGKKR